MKKEQLEKFNKFNRDLLEWIKYFLTDKVEHQKVQDGYHDDKKKAEAQKLKYFDRKLWQLRIMNCKTHDELDEVSRNIKNNGIRSHGTFSVPLLNFYEYVKGVKRLKSIKDIDTNIINVYVELKLSDKSEWTQRNYYSHIKSLFKFIDKYSIRDDNEIFDIGITLVGKRAKSPIKKAPEKSTKYLEPEEYVKFVSSIESYFNNHPNRKQPNFLIKVIALTGLRASEARNLKFSDVTTRTVDGEKYLQLYVNGKNNVDGYVFVYYEYIKDEYETEIEFRKENNIKTKYLFYTRAYEQYAEKSLYDLIKRYLKHAGIKKPMDTHGLRRSYATYLLARGTSREKISHLLRHTDSEMLDFYAFASERSFKSVKDLMDEINREKKDFKGKKRTRKAKS